MEKNVKKGQVYWAHLEGAQGSEQNGTRPVIVIQNNKGNECAPTTIIAPLTTHISCKPLPTVVYIAPQDSGLKRLCSAHLEQIRTIDKTRLGDLVGQVSFETIKEINKALRISLEL